MTRLPHNLNEAREWAKLKLGSVYGDSRVRRWIGRAFLLGHRDKPAGIALVIDQNLWDDAWRLGRKCRQHEQDEKIPRGNGAPAEGYYRARGIRRINLRLAPDVAAMLDEMATGIRDVTPTISEAIRLLHARWLAAKTP